MWIYCTINKSVNFSETKVLDTNWNISLSVLYIHTPRIVVGCNMEAKVKQIKI